MIETWKMTAVENAASFIGWGGLVIGIVFGFLVARTNFCTMGSISDILSFGSYNRFRSWLLAAATAMLGVWVIQGAGMVDTSMSMYRTGDFGWGGNIIGGLVFGFGMVFAGGCASRNLVRAGGGDLRSMVVLIVMGIFAYMTIAGPLAYMRIWVFGGGSEAPTPPSIAFALSDQLGLSLTWVGMGLGFCIFALAAVRRPIWQHLKTMFWGGLVAGAIVSGWIGTQWIATHGFEELPVVTHTFSAPIGESLIYLMSASGNSVSFATGSVLGVLIGAFLGSIFKGHFRWEACDDARELRRQIFVAALMGVGSVLALGCSVGQGLSAFSTLAYGAPVTLICIMIGAAIGLRQLIQGFHQID